jgi:hypothetical protein
LDVGLAILTAVTMKDIRACPQIRKLRVMNYEPFYFISVRSTYFPLDVIASLLSGIRVGLDFIAKVTGLGDHFTLTKDASVLIMKQHLHVDLLLCTFSSN